MKRASKVFMLASLAVLTASTAVASGVPSAITLQGRLTDGAGNNVADGSYSVDFKIYDDSSGGSIVWSETLPVQVSGGLFTVLIGKGMNFPVDLFSGFAKYFLGITVSPEPELPRIPLTSVAYAFQSEDADVATLALDLMCAGCVAAGEIAADAVGASEIAPGAVGFSEIAFDAVTSVAIAAGSVESDELVDGGVQAIDIAANAVGEEEITTSGVVGGAFGDVMDGTINTWDITDNSLVAADIADEPGVASNTSDAEIFLPYDTILTLRSRSIFAPAPGYVLVIATAGVEIHHTNGMLSNAFFGVSTSAGDFPFNQDLPVITPSTYPTGLCLQAVTVHGLFATPGGLDDFYFLGVEYSGDVRASNLQFTLIYFPTAHGTVVSTAATSSGEELSTGSGETGSILPATNVDPNQTRLTADIEARIQQLEAKLRAIETNAENKR